MGHVRPDTNTSVLSIKGNSSFVMPQEGTLMVQGLAEFNEE